jgi:hypothetical protein
MPQQGIECPGDMIAAKAAQDTLSHPIEQDEEQMRFLAECLRRYGGA